MEKVYKLLKHLYGDDVDNKTVRLMSREEWADKENQKSIRIYDLDRE
jgi:hypothetical protein